ncbi:hypothetical protein BC829DRAFT_247307 [Chytridium lagenaria]|nr:hypothetical protein BC829DRAFT_247307 [Chytridium lagenaria]
MQSENGDLICVVERTLVSSVKNSFVATDAINAPICKLVPLDGNERDLVIFQNQFGGMYIRRGIVRHLNRTQAKGRQTTQYELKHDSCDVEWRLTVIDEHNSKTALFHMKDSADAIAEIRWCPDAEYRWECPLRGLRRTPTLELLIAGAVVMRYGVRGLHKKLMSRWG